MPILYGNTFQASVQLKGTIHCQGTAQWSYDNDMPDLSSPPLDLDLRLVRYFTVVAEHRHFGRAAAALHLAQPSLSRQIQRLEQQLGARLLARTPQGSQLTEA